MPQIVPTNQQFCFWMLLFFSTTAKELCKLDSLNKTVTFSSLLEFQANIRSFDPDDPSYQGNAVNLNFQTIDRLLKNSFISFDSNNVINLSLNNNEIRIIDSGAFNGLFCLHFLGLRDNYISSIHASIFNGLDNLRQLDLSQNAFHRISENGRAFHTLTKLVVLNLSKNAIVTLNELDFFDLPSLEVLDLSFNEINVIPPNLFATLYNLEELFLNNNNINKIEPEQWKDLSTLELLNLASNFINKFDLTYNFSFINLKKLNLSQNSLNYLNASILGKQFSKLEVIDISANNFYCYDLEVIEHQLIDFNISMLGVVNCRYRQYRYSAADKSSSTSSSNSTVRTITTVKNNNTQDHSNQIFAQNGRILFTNNKVLENVQQLQALVGYLCAIVIVFLLIDISVRIGLCQYFYDRVTGRRRVQYLDDGNDRERMVLLRR